MHNRQKLSIYRKDVYAISKTTLISHVLKSLHYGELEGQQTDSGLVLFPNMQISAEKH